MRIKLLLLSLLTPLLCGVSFASSSTFLTGYQFGNDAKWYRLPSSYDFICLNYTFSYSDYNLDIVVARGGYPVVNFTVNTSNLREYCFHTSNFGNDIYTAYIITHVSNTSATGFVNWYGYKIDDCSSIQSQLNTCSSALSGVSANLSSCQSDLSSCSNGCDTLVNQCLNEKSILSGNLASCNEDKSSLQNYNESLSSQLNECLSNSCDIITGMNFIQYDIFWKDGNDNFSLPITNSLFLPYGYKGKLNNGVLSIVKNNSLEYAYSIDDNSFQTDVVDMFGKVFLFFMSSGLFLVFLYVIRRYFIGLKSIK